MRPSLRPFETEIDHLSTPISDWVPASRGLESHALSARKRMILNRLLASKYFGGMTFGKIPGGNRSNPAKAPAPSSQPLIPASAYAAGIHLSANNVELGTDRGLLWLDSGVLNFEGLETRFAVGKDDVVRVQICDAIDDAHSVLLNAMGHLLCLSVLHLNTSDYADLRRTLSQWSGYSKPAPSALFPPIAIKPMRRRYVLAKAMRRATVIYGMLAGLLLFDAISVGAGFESSFRFRVDAIVLVAVLHLVTLSYRKVRREEEAAIRDYRPLGEVSDPSQYKAEELSVGVRLNTL